MLREGAVTKPVSVPGLDELKALLKSFGLVDPNGKTMADDTLEARVTAFLLRDRHLDDEDRRQVEPLFPIDIPAMSATDLTLSSPFQVPIDPTRPYIANLGRLVFDAGGYILVRNTPFTLSADDVVVNGVTAGRSHFEILGQDAARGDDGERGGDAGNGGDGGDGGEGGDGSEADHGPPAGPTRDAVITVARSLGGAHALTLFTRSGDGGDGGRGGNGKRGGHGGPGGDGSDAVDALGSISVTLPAGTPKSSFSHISARAVNGRGGGPGEGGEGGSKGNGGSGGKKSGNGGDGTAGTKGVRGRHGKDATGTAGAPAVVRVQI